MTMKHKAATGWLVGLMSLGLVAGVAAPAAAATREWGAITCSNPVHIEIHSRTKGSVAHTASNGTAIAWNNSVYKTRKSNHGGGHFSWRTVTANSISSASSPCTM